MSGLAEPRPRSAQSPLKEPSTPTRLASGTSAQGRLADALSRQAGSASPGQAAPTNRSLDQELEQAAPELHPEAASLDAALDRHQMAAAAIRQRLLESRQEAALVSMRVALYLLLLLL